MEEEDSNTAPLIEQQSEAAKMGQMENTDEPKNNKRKVSVNIWNRDQIMLMHFRKRHTTEEEKIAMKNKFDHGYQKAWTEHRRFQEKRWAKFLDALFVEWQSVRKFGVATSDLFSMMQDLLDGIAQLSEKLEALKATTLEELRSDWIKEAQKQD
jgi:hypothetical protein